MGSQPPQRRRRAPTPQALPLERLLHDGAELFVRDDIIKLCNLVPTDQLAGIARIFPIPEMAIHEHDHEMGGPAGGHTTIKLNYRVLLIVIKP